MRGERESYMITMKDIIREGHPTLRETAQPVAFPLSEEDITLGQEMLEFLAHRFEYAGVSETVAKWYARDIRKILEEHYGDGT